MITFDEFEKWIKGHKRLSILLIALFCLGALDQFAGYSQRLVELLTPKANFEITRFETSIRNSIYYEWGKLREDQQPKSRTTQFADPKYRQFRYNENYGDNFGQRPGQGIVVAMIVLQYALAKLELPGNVREKYKTFLEETPESREQFKEFFWTLVPAQRFQYEFHGGQSFLKHFIQGSDLEHRWFLRALEQLHDSPSRMVFTFRGKPLKHSTADNLVREHFALFNSGFLPVFEIYVRSHGSRAVTIDRVEAEVLDIAEYMGGAEAIPASEIVTIPVAYKKGFNQRPLAGDEQINIQPGDEVRILLRLEPQEKLSSYLMRIHVYAGTVRRTTDVFAVDM